MFYEITNPITGRKIKSTSKLGKKVLKTNLELKKQIISNDCEYQLDNQLYLKDFINIAKSNHLTMDLLRPYFIKKTINCYLKQKEINIDLYFYEMDYQFTSIYFYISRNLYTSFPNMLMTELYMKLIGDVSSRIDMEVSYLNYNSS